MQFFSLIMASILWANVRWDHMGGHSGLAPFSNAVAACWGEGFQRVAISHNIAPKTPTVFARLVRKLRPLPAPAQTKPAWEQNRDLGSPFYGERGWGLEQAISRQVAQTAPAFVMLECIEDQFFGLAEERKKWTQTKLVGMTHQPPAWWRLHHRRPEIVQSLDLLLVLASGVKSFWSQYLPPEKIAFLPHGVDTAFFTPLNPGAEESESNQPLRVVFSGQWLRDFETLAAVIKQADQQALNMTFDLIVPRHVRNTPACYQMAMSPRVRWQANLSDEELRQAYQQADVLLLPLTDATANNGLLEGMACGLPVIVTDVGGVRDYANEQFADFVRPGDVVEIIKLLKKSPLDKAGMSRRGTLARDHVEANFSWDMVAKTFVSILNDLSD